MRPAAELLDSTTSSAANMAKQRGLSLKALMDEIYAVADGFDSWKDAVTGFEGHPVGWKYIYSLIGVDADIRNGGIYQLHHNSTWHLILDAADGAKAFGLKDLHKNLKDILFYYHRIGRSKMRKRIPAGYFDDLSPKWNKSLAKLEDEYYRCFERRHWNDGINDLIKVVVQSNPELVGQPL